MLLLARVDALHYVFAVPMVLLSIFLILVVLVQRGRGGGLTGALGGMGGQSAFGTKAGDLFTKITIVVAAVWILLAMAAVKVLNHRTPIAGADQRGIPLAPAAPGEGGGTPGGGGFELPGGTGDAPAGTGGGDAPSSTPSGDSAPGDNP